MPQCTHFMVTTTVINWNTSFGRTSHLLLCAKTPNCVQPRISYPAWSESVAQLLRHYSSSYVTYLSYLIWDLSVWLSGFSFHLKAPERGFFFSPLSLNHCCLTGIMTGNGGSYTDWWLIPAEANTLLASCEDNPALSSGIKKKKKKGTSPQMKRDVLSSSSNVPAFNGVQLRLCSS